MLDKVRSSARSSHQIPALYGSLGVLFLGAVTGFSLDRYWPEPLPPPHIRILPTVDIDGRSIVVRIPGTELIGELGRYEDGLFAYLLFDYLRGRPSFRGTELFLTYSPLDRPECYRIRSVLSNDFDTGISQLFEFARRFPFLTPAFSIVDSRVLPYYRDSTARFLRAYNCPVHSRLEQLPQARMVSFTTRFIRFKSLTDPRIRRRGEPLPRALDELQARRLAEDIVNVARFYKLPIDFFLGIGAMENNFMDVRGDLGHTLWKRHAAPDDVVIARSRGHVLVLNESLGVWQITTETLRYAHSLYLRDQRDYARLPAALIPPKRLRLSNLNAQVLTTYAGILFRDLLDRFPGDVASAVGAFNGGPTHPNRRYEEGVRLVARYARRVVEHAAILPPESTVAAQLHHPSDSLLPNGAGQ